MIVFGYWYTNRSAEIRAARDLKEVKRAAKWEAEKMASRRAKGWEL